jgi:hypothetical protein
MRSVVGLIVGWLESMRGTNDHSTYSANEFTGSRRPVSTFPPRLRDDADAGNGPTRILPTPNALV